MLDFFYSINLSVDKVLNRNIGRSNYMESGLFRKTKKNTCKSNCSQVSLQNAKEQLLIGKIKYTEGKMKFSSKIN
jgi:hypothetical protein